MKIATYNINSIRNRLQRLLEWLDEAKPDVVCLQELRIYHEEFPVGAIRDAGYGMLYKGQKPRYNGVAILARGTDPVEVRFGLPGDTDPVDAQSRYVEAAVEGVLIGCLYAPNGNPQPGPKFDRKLRWLDLFVAHAATLYDSGQPVVLAGDYNIVPTPFDIYQTTSYDKDALVQPESRERYRALLDQGWVDSIRTLHPDDPMYTFWDYFRQRWPRNAGLRIDHLLLNPQTAKRLKASGVDRDVRGREGASDHAPAWVELKAR